MAHDSAEQSTIIYTNTGDNLFQFYIPVVCNHSYPPTEAGQIVGILTFAPAKSLILRGQAIDQIPALYPRTANDSADLHWFSAKSKPRTYPALWGHYKSKIPGHLLVYPWVGP